MAGQMLKAIKCPVCGKEFVPAPMHIYKTRVSPKGSELLVCSWTCVRNGEKMTDAQRKRKERVVQWGKKVK